jgi:hypothetical protein
MSGWKCRQESCLKEMVGKLQLVVNMASELEQRQVTNLSSEVGTLQLLWRLPLLER